MSQSKVGCGSIRENPNPLGIRSADYGYRYDSDIQLSARIGGGLRLQTVGHPRISVGESEGQFY